MITVGAGFWTIYACYQWLGKGDRSWRVIAIASVALAGLRLVLF